MLWDKWAWRQTLPPVCLRRAPGLLPGGLQHQGRSNGSRADHGRIRRITGNLTNIMEDCGMGWVDGRWCTHCCIHLLIDSQNVRSNPLPMPPHEDGSRKMETRIISDVEQCLHMIRHKVNAHIAAYPGPAQASQEAPPARIECNAGLYFVP